MRKKFAALLVVAMATMSLYAMPVANAAPCANGTVISPPGNCSVLLSVVVPAAANLTFTSVSTSFGTRLPGTTATLTAAITGTFHVNTGTGTLTVSCFEDRPAGFTGTSQFAIQFDAGTFINTNGSGSTLACTSALNGGGGTRTTTSTTPFSDSVKVTLDAGQATGTYTQTLTYALAVA